MAGSSMAYFILKQLPMVPPNVYQSSIPWLGQDRLADWIRLRVLELSFTARDIEALARDLGYDGPPFGWDEERRALIRAELDALYFHLYGLDQSEVRHVLDSFDALQRREEKPLNFGEFRTRKLILQRYEAMAEAIETGKPYQTVLDPPPGKGPRHG
jgi:hypothetical protein